MLIAVACVLVSIGEFLIGLDGISVSFGMHSDGLRQILLDFGDR